MGINNRDRRRRKKRREERRDRGEGARRVAPNREVARAGVLAAAEAFRFDARSEYEKHLARLGALEEGGFRRVLDEAIAWWVEQGLDRSWNSGWQPADVVRALRRTLSPAHAAVVAPAVADSGGRRPEARSDERWAAQVEAIRAEGAGATSSATLWLDVPLAVEAVSLLLHLPPLPRLSAPTRHNDQADGRFGAMLERVRALLAKAESTTFPEEAEALSAKAQELMARHAIDRAMLAAEGGERPGDVVGWRIGIEDPYPRAKSLLLDRIAAASGCRAVWSRQLGFSTVFGNRRDLEMVEVLFTSLLVQATDAMVRAGRSVDRSGRSRTRSFRQSFLIAYAGRIGERLTATTERVVAEGTARHGAALLPVLARRKEAVEDAVRTAYPDLVHRGSSITNYSGWLAGRAAAEVASLSFGDELAAG